MKHWPPSYFAMKNAQRSNVSNTDRTKKTDLPFFIEIMIYSGVFIGIIGFFLPNISQICILSIIIFILAFVIAILTGIKENISKNGFSIGFGNKQSKVIVKEIQCPNCKKISFVVNNPSSFECSFCGYKGKLREWKVIDKTVEWKKK